MARTGAEARRADGGRSGCAPGGSARPGGAPIWSTALLFLVVAGAYGPSLRNDFLYDDNILIVRAPAPSSARDLARVFLEHRWTNLPYYRPLPHLTMVLQKWLHGNRPAPYRLFNTLLMGAAAVLAYALLRLPSFGIPPPLALLASAAFALHPIASACVYQIAGREILLTSIFGLAALQAFLRSGGRWYTVALATFAGALLCREHALTLPGAFLLADALGLSQDAPGRRWAAWVRRYAPVLAIALAYLAIRSLVLPQSDPYRLVLLERPTGPLLSLYYALQTTLTPFVEVVYEPREVIWNAGWRRFAWPLATLLLGLAVAANWARLGTRALFFCGWILLGLLPTANLLHQEARFAERYGFQSLLGFVGILGLLGATRWERPRARRWIAASGLALVAACAVISVQRAGSYRDHVTFLEQWLRSDPAACQPNLSLARVYDERGDLATAVEYYQRTVASCPNDADTRRALAAALLKRGELARAATHLERAIQLEPRSRSAHYQLGLVLLKQGEPGRAIEHLERAVQLDPDFAKAQRLLGIARARSRDPARADPQPRRAPQADPDLENARRSAADAPEELAPDGEAGAP